MMMDKDEAVFAALFIGVIVGLFLGGFALHDITGDNWQRAAIEHHAAHYDPTSGEFTWNKEEASQ